MYGVQFLNECFHCAINESHVHIHIENMEIKGLINNYYISSEIDIENEKFHFHVVKKWSKFTTKSNANKIMKMNFLFKFQSFNHLLNKLSSSPKAKFFIHYYLLYTDRNTYHKSFWMHWKTVIVTNYYSFCPLPTVCSKFSHSFIKNVN